jgi:plasmid maintenance system antidote protein VapI
MGELRALKGAITEKGENYRKCAEACGMSVQSFNSKINGRIAFTCWEVRKLSEYLGLSREDIVRIFML